MDYFFHDFLVGYLPTPYSLPYTPHIPKFLDCYSTLSNHALHTINTVIFADTAEAEGQCIRILG